MSTIRQTSIAARLMWAPVEPWRRCLGNRMATAVALVGMVAVLCAAPQVSDGAIPAPAAPAQPAVATHRAASTPLRPQNRHLQWRAKAKETVQALRHKVRAVRARVLRPRVIVRHAMGTVTGTVHNAKGYPLAGASVHLTKPGGHRLHSRRARHATATNAAGEYTMRSVRPGKYRVVAAERGAGHGHAAARVHSNATATANVGVK